MEPSKIMNMESAAVSHSLYRNWSVGRVKKLKWVMIRSRTSFGSKDSKIC